MMDIGSFPHQVTRLVFDTGQPYQEFRARYAGRGSRRSTRKRLAGIRAVRGAAWAGGRRGRRSPRPRTPSSSSGASTLTPVMSLAGNTTRCTAYLMGNHTIAEQMYRHDPAVMLYVPLRTVINGRN